MLCCLTADDSGSERPRGQLRVVNSGRNAPPLRGWLGDWLDSCPLSNDGRKVLSLWHMGHVGDPSWNYLFLKAYQPL